MAVVYEARFTVGHPAEKMVFNVETRGEKKEWNKLRRKEKEGKINKEYEVKEERRETRGKVKGEKGEKEERMKEKDKERRENTRKMNRN